MINSTAYYNDFWNEMRGKQAVTDSLYNNRESKTNAYHLPGESNKKYTAVLRKESAVRQLATIVNATRSDSRLWTFDCEGQAEWGDMVNLETDLIGKYVEKLLQPAPEDTRRPITRELLLRYGF